MLLIVTKSTWMLDMRTRAYLQPNKRIFIQNFENFPWDWLESHENGSMNRQWKRLAEEEINRETNATKITDSLLMEIQI